MPSDFPSQNAGKPTNEVASHWRKSMLASPQTAGIPTEFNENGVDGDGGLAEPESKVDLTGGVMKFRKEK